MAVRVRLFAALREAAGVAELEVEPAPLADLLDGLRARFGEPFATRLTACSVLLDGDPAPRDGAVAVSDGAELALLPPVSGGSDDACRETRRPGRSPGRPPGRPLD